MNNIIRSWESGFYLASLILLVSIPFGYFISSLAFAIWALYSCFWIIMRKNFKINKFMFPLLFFSVITLISLLWTQDYESTLHGIGRQFPLFVFATIGVFLPTIPKYKLQQILKVFAVFLCFLAIALLTLAVFKYQKYQYKNFLYYHDLVSPLGLNAIYVSYIVSVVFLITLKNFGKKNKWLFTVLLILFLFLVMLSSKTILLITLVLSLAIGFKKIKGKMPKLSILVILGVLILLIIKFAKPVKDRFSTELNTSLVEIFNADHFEKGRAFTGLEARLLQARTFTEIVNTPFEYAFGAGLDATKKEIGIIHQKLNTPVAFQSYNFHNQYLQVFAELGLIGFILLILLLFVGFKKSKIINFMSPFILVTVALFLTESVIWRQRGIMFFGIMYILLMTSSNTYESRKSISEV